MARSYRWPPGRMPYSRATVLLRRLFHAHLEAERRGVPALEVLEEQRVPAEARRRVRSALDRREFLRAIGLSGAAAAATPRLGFGMSRSDARVVIIGGGLAGMSCARRLARHGVAADLFEAADRLGGRTFTDTTSFDGLVTERGGSFISTEHTAVRNLARNLGLRLEAINGGALSEGEEIYRIDGEFYTIEEANEDWAFAWKAFKEELHDAPWPQLFDSFTPRGAELDSISVPDWFDPANPLAHPILAEFGPDSRFAKLCYSDVIVEYGGDPEVQPALNLLYLLAWNPINSITPLPGTDEFYHVEGGNERLIARMAEDIEATFPGRLHTGRPLAALSGPPEGPYTCTFANGSTVVADKLVLTLPFRILRELDVEPRLFESFTPAKQRAIKTMPMGTNGKIHIELAHRTWGPDFARVIEGKARVLNGVSYSDPDTFQCVWDDSVPVEAGRVILLHYPGGTLGRKLRGKGVFGTANPADVKRVLDQIEPVFPGTDAAYTGRAVQSFWTAEPWHRGAYSFWGIGDYTSYVGAAAPPEGHIHFAGEHTSVEFQGFMEGAARSGMRAAQEVLQSI